MEIRWTRMIASVAITIATALPAAAQPRSTVSVVPLDCGRIDIADMDAFADDGSYKGVSKQMVVSCYLIRHPRGDLLWDAGIGDQFAGPQRRHAAAGLCGTYASQPCAGGFHACA